MVLVTDRNHTMAEQMRSTRSTDYEVSALLMELTKGADGKEQGTGTLFQAAKLGFDKEKKQNEIESLGCSAHPPHGHQERDKEWNS